MADLSERERRRRFKNRVLLVALLAFVVVVYAVSVVKMGSG